MRREKALLEERREKERAANASRPPTLHRPPVGETAAASETGEIRRDGGARDDRAIASQAACSANFGDRRVVIRRRAFVSVTIKRFFAFLITVTRNTLRIHFCVLSLHPYPSERLRRLNARTLYSVEKKKTSTRLRRDHGAFSSLPTTPARARSAWRRSRRPRTLCDSVPERVRLEPPLAPQLCSNLGATAPEPCRHRAARSDSRRTARARPWRASLPQCPRAPRRRRRRPRTTPRGALFQKRGSRTIRKRRFRVFAFLDLIRAPRIIPCFRARSAPARRRSGKSGGFENTGLVPPRKRVVPVASLARLPACTPPASA